MALAEDKLEDSEEEEHMKCVYLEKECYLWVAEKRRKGHRHVPMVIKELGALLTR